MKSFTVVIIAFLTFSCVEKVIEKPENLIPKEKMADILYDMTLYQATESVNKSIVDSYDVEMMQLIYTTYKIDSTAFVESDLYYASIPLVYQSIYEEVEAKIEAKRLALEQVRKRRSDSIRQIQKKQTDSLKQFKKPKRTSEILP
jgi:hypothetical protein